jgi:hypothetical protein
MKKLLLVFLFAFSIGSAKSQILNEIMAIASNCNNPNGGAEYFEVYGNSGAVNLDCYALVVYFQSASERGFYVVDLPNFTSAPNSSGQWWYVVSSQLNFCIAQNNGGSANASWNTLGVKKYVFNSTTNTYNAPTTITNLTDLFMETGGGGGTTFSHNAMLFSYQTGTTATLVNGVFSNMSQPAVFPLVNIMNDPQVPGLPPDIPAAINCGANTYAISFAGLGATSVEYLTQNAGSGNGYYREQDGVCGTWDKASAASEHTPGSFAPGGSTTTQYSISGTLPACFDENPDPNIFDLGYKSDFTFIYPATDNPYTIEYYIIKDDGDNVLEPSPSDTYYGPFTEDNNPVLNPANTISITLPDAIDGDRYFIRAKSLQGCFFATATVICPSCATLPVTFTFFNGKRNRSNVELTWQTATEENSRGFHVQRRIGNGNWETVGFVPSAGRYGNSSMPLSYSFIDVNTSKAMTQYRLQQEDIDGKKTFTNIVAIRGEDQKGKTIIYPNPSNEGKVNVVFEDVNTVRDVTLIDLNGRILRQWRNITGNNLQIDNLTTGFYTLRILNTGTNELIVEKIVVKK